MFLKVMIDTHDTKRTHHYKIINTFIAPVCSEFKIYYSDEFLIFISFI